MRLSIHLPNTRHGRFAPLQDIDAAMVRTKSMPLIVLLGRRMSASH